MRPGDPVEIRRDGRVISRSRNLRGLLRRFGKVPVERICIVGYSGQPFGASLFVLFADGAESLSTWAGGTDHVADWISARRNLQGVPVEVVPANP